MCQSKSDGGIRCESHVKKALSDHRIEYSEMVQKECADKGIAIAPTSLELTFDEASAIRTQVNTDSYVQKARAEAQNATNHVNKMRHTLNAALVSHDVNRLATLIRESNPEFKAINADNEARRIKLSEALARARTEEEKETAQAVSKHETALLNARKLKLNGFSKQQAVNAHKLYRVTGSSVKALETLKCLQDATRNAMTTRDSSQATIVRVRERMNKLAIAHKLVNDPGYQQAESSAEFRSSPEFLKWNDKERELHESYRMTAAYQNQVAAKITHYKTAGMDTSEMEKAYKALTIRKARFVYQNVVEAHGALSKEAATARTTYAESKQKEHVFA